LRNCKDLFKKINMTNYWTNIEPKNLSAWNIVPNWWELSQIEVSKATSLNYDINAKSRQKENTSRPTVRKWYLNKLWNIKDKYILDAWCWVGIDTLTMAENWAKWVWLDYSKKSIEEAKKLVKDFPDRNFINTDIMEYKSERKFDIILFSMAIMHHKDLFSIMKKFDSLLKKWWKLLIVTNNAKLVCKDYWLDMPWVWETIQYTHYLGENKDVPFIKFVHSDEDFIEQASKCWLKMVDYDDIAVYGDETAYFNNKDTTDINTPNFVSFMFEKIS